MLSVVYSNLNGLSIIDDSNQGRLLYVDDGLTIYDKIAYDDYFVVEPIEFVKTFIKATLKYFEGTQFPQFMIKAILDFNKSDFCKEAIELERSYKNED